MSDELYWDPYDTSFVADPWPLFKRLREEAPLYYNDKHDFYAVSRAADVERAITDWQSFSSAKGDILEIVKSGFDIPPGTVIMEDPPVHALHRSLLVKVFTPRRVAAIEPQIRRFAAACLDPYIDADSFDLMKIMGAEMPMRVIGMMLGIPESDQASIRDQADDRLRTEAGGQMDLSDGNAIASIQAFGDYVDFRIKNPSDDLMSELIHTEFEDETGVRRTLTRDEVVTYITVVAGAGNETTGRLIGWLGATLARHPDERAKIVADPKLIPRAVEETLRYEPPGPFMARYVTTDVEFHGQKVPAGSALLMLLGAANRDPDYYPDPDRFDVTRQMRQTFSFGLGPHYCLGAGLARLEGRVALDEILKRWVEWDVDWDSARMAPTSSVRGWESLPLRVTAAR